MPDPEQLPNFARAQLVPFKDETNLDMQKAIPVVFNPATLKLAVNNQNQDAGGASGKRDTAAQFVHKFSTTLNLELTFDTTLPYKGANESTLEANSDVRRITSKMIELFLEPEEREDKKPSAPKRVQFQWGSFLFSGSITSYSETLEFFAPEGIPLRAIVDITISEDRVKVEFGEAKAASRDTPTFSAAPAAQSLPSALQDAGKDPRAWRSSALFNGLETPRFSANMQAGILSSHLQAGLQAGSALTSLTSVPGIPAGEVVTVRASSSGVESAASPAALGVGFSLPTSPPTATSPSAGFSFGASSQLGSKIPGAFKCPV